VKRAPALLLGGVWLGTWVVGLIDVPSSARSFAQLSESVNSSVILVWPLAAGVGVAQAVAAHKGGVLERAAAWPGRGQARYAWTEAWHAWLGAAAGAVCSWIATAVVASVLGSPVSTASLPGLAVGLAGTLALLLWGWVGGLLARSYAAAVIAPLLVYGALWLFPAYTIFDLVSFTGATGLIGTAVGLSFAGTVTLAAVQILAVAAAVLVLWAMTATAAQSRPGRWLDMAGGFSCAAGAVFLYVIGPAGAGDGLWQVRGPDAWTCREIGAGSTACLPRDLRAIDDEFFGAMERADPYLRMFVGGDVTLLYAEDEAASSEDHDELVYLGTDLVDPTGLWADYLVTYVGSLPVGSLPAGSELPGNATEDCIAATDWARDTWRKVLDGRDVAEDEVRRVLEMVAGC
jgi:hypothetical protein